MARRKVFGTAFHEDTFNAMYTLDNADVACYQAGTSTPIDMYANQVGGSPLASLKTDDKGYYEFWIEWEQHIKIEITKLTYDPIVRDWVWIPTDIIYGGDF